MPLINGLRSTTVWKAFLLNAISSTLIVIAAIATKSALDKAFKTTAGVATMLLTALSTFVAAYASYTVMHVLFGFGSGMLA